MVPGLWDYSMYPTLLHRKPNPPERWGDGPVAVQTEDEQVEDGGSGGGVVDADPELADDHPKEPLLGEDVDGADGHDNQTHDQVSNGQRDDEHVAHLLETKTMKEVC